MRGYCAQTQSKFDERNMRPRALFRKGYVRFFLRDAAGFLNPLDQSIRFLGTPAS